MTLNTKKVALQGNDPGSRGIVTVILPEGYVEIVAGESVNLKMDRPIRILLSTMLLDKKDG